MTIATTSAFTEKAKWRNMKIKRIQIQWRIYFNLKKYWVFHQIKLDGRMYRREYAQISCQLSYISGIINFWTWQIEFGFIDVLNTRISIPITNICRQFFPKKIQFEEFFDIRSKIHSNWSLKTGKSVYIDEILENSKIYLYLSRIYEHKKRNNIYNLKRWGRWF